MKLPMMPRNLTRVADDEQFDFDCHSGVTCFTHCCRQLELALTPYDTMRLKNNLQLHSREFLDRYVIIEQEPEDAFPRYYLTMVDDGNASCVFVTAAGCSVYPDRPGACRAYPMGRASMRKKDNSTEEFYVLLREDHCKGFEQSRKQSPVEYSSDQGLDLYNRINDSLIAIQQHEEIRKGRKLTTGEAGLYTLSLYDLDTFREQLFTGKVAPLKPLSAEDRNTLADDTRLLIYGVEWLKASLFTAV